ncbi:RraA-like protein [Trichodelitschia bisporula]|uniref:RraA-like protein n=1 Tax=Trichodelitschia bisporula TaxID=703511 RepID=A0A6G1HXZ5_9PEZI|nr:RraA-like protein [Trichodelitschia bisporula]
MSTAQLEALSAYTACDISDALLKLSVPGAGFLPNILPLPQTTTPHQPAKYIAPASTVLFLPHSTPSFPNPPPPLDTLTTALTTPLPNIPPGVPYADLAVPGTIMLLSQPADQHCAVLGGIMAARIAARGVRGVLVDGRVRDLGEIRGTGIPVWSKGVSTVGAGAQTKAWAVGCEVQVGETVVRTGDIIMIDPSSHAAVSIPAELLQRVLDMLPRLTAADENVLREVKEGLDVAGAFKRWRS